MMLAHVWDENGRRSMGLRLQLLREAVRDKVGWRDAVRVVTRGRLRPDGTRCQGVIKLPHDNKTTFETFQPSSEYGGFVY